ncbi:phosphatase PAP2 family protein [Aquibacillus rhizosphaerae]|uniref:Phosphatase PAP2 family protein n=1 Tax=Aquibacillus rhizosphaerae TaxID=3051431 RepID=A0ABT7L8Y0_9BACI|nr:phosphatase PAP2 family protein [Aquibacillus sp. LR5S19]MDL4842325.1 phosphatase PAP2 family protein [Aquibacillus sp. LR5S19]
MDKQLIKKLSIPIIVLLIGLGIISLFTYIFVELGEDLLAHEIQLFDSSIIEFLKTLETDTLDQIMIFITELGSVWFLTTMSIFVVLALWFKAKDKWGITAFIVAIAGGGTITKVLKHHYDRGRPSINPEIDAVGYSFPSGHSMGSLIFYGFAIYLVAKSKRSKPVKWCFAILASFLIFLIGTSRAYLGAHFPSDVFAGFLAGFVWMTLCILALEWAEWRTKYHIRPFRAIRNLFVQRFHDNPEK